MCVLVFSLQTKNERESKVKALLSFSFLIYKENLRVLFIFIVMF